MEDQPSSLTAGDMFENGVVYCCEYDQLVSDGTCTKDTLRAFVDLGHRDWEAVRLKAHHIDSAKLYNWVIYGPGGADDEVPNEDVFYAVVHSAQGSSDAFVVNGEGSLRVFLQHAVNHWKHHRKCRLVFYDRCPAGVVVHKEDIPATFVDGEIKSEDGRN